MKEFKSPKIIIYKNVDKLVSILENFLSQGRQVIDKLLLIYYYKGTMKNIKIYTCKRCSHMWANRKNQKPRVCPKCKSPYWDTDRRKKSNKKEK